MKSNFFLNMTKGLVVLGAALAFVNCTDDTDSISDAKDAINSEMENLNHGESENIGELPLDSLSLGDSITNPPLDPNIPENPGVVESSSSIVNITEIPMSSSEKNLMIVSSSSETPVLESSSSEVVVPEETGIFLANDKDEDQSYMEIEYKENTGHDGGAILAYPKRLSETKKHGVVVWGPGGGTAPGAYGGMIRRLASHGFVVIALSVSPGDASQAIPALNWLEEQNNNPSSPLYNKLDMNVVGCSGHSMGGLESEQALIKDSRVKTAVMNNSGDLGHSAMAQVSPNKSIAIVYGEGGMERPNAEADYHNAGVSAPACLIKMTGGNGSECYNGECGYGHGSAAWDGVSATVAWMRWHLGGENFRKADFVGTSGKYINGDIKLWQNGHLVNQGKWAGQCKNF